MEGLYAVRLSLVWPCCAVLRRMHASFQDSIAQATTARPTLSYEDLGFTNVLRPGGGAVTTRCRRSMGWETPDQIDERLQGEFAMLRLAKSPPVLLKVPLHVLISAPLRTCAVLVSADARKTRTGSRYDVAALDGKVRIRRSQRSMGQPSKAEVEHSNTIRCQAAKGVRTCVRMSG
jgi:hypothetical protein